MCNVWRLGIERPEVTENELSFSEGKTILEELSRLGTRLLYLSGGEPLLRKDIFDIIREAKEQQLEVVMITNGTLITEYIAEETVSSGLDEIVFSIDAHEAEAHDDLRGVKGSWEKAIRGMKQVDYMRRKQRNNRLRISLNVLVTRTNFKLLDKMIALKSQLGYDSIYFLPLICKTQSAKSLLLTAQDLHELRKRYMPIIKRNARKQGLPRRKLSTLTLLCKNAESTIEGKYAVPVRNEIVCSHPWRMATIDPFGNVYPCCYACTFQNLSEDLKHSFWGNIDLNMGNVRHHTFKEIWNGHKFVEFRKECKKPLAFSMCSFCNYDFTYDVLLTAIFKRKIMNFFKLLPHLV